MKMIKAIVEIPKGSIYKYEIKDNELILDRVINQPIPYNYGYIPNTMCGDGDPLDIFILSKDYIPPTTKVSVLLLGVFQCLDNGDIDDKLIGVLIGETSEDLLTVRDRIRNYLETYKEGFEVCFYSDSDVAEEILRDCKFPSPPEGML